VGVDSSERAWGRETVVLFVDHLVQVTVVKRAVSPVKPDVNDNCTVKHKVGLRITSANGETITKSVNAWQKIISITKTVIWGSI
jgi:hypothetical protein